MTTSEYNTNDAKIFVFGMPCWGVDAPYYTIAYLSGLIRHYQVNPFPYDVNHDFYLSVAEDDKKLWKPEYNSKWVDKSFSQRLFNKYHKWFAQYLKSVLDIAPKNCVMAFTVNTWNQTFVFENLSPIKNGCRNPKQMNCYRTC